MTPDPARRAWFPGLNAVRALGATCVVGTHVGFQTGRSAYGPFAGSIARLDCGVALFFVLSGFLLFRPYALGAAASPPRRPSTGRYLARRAARILPAYWLVVVACMLCLPPLASSGGAGDWLRHLTLTQIYGLGLQHHGLTQTWSLCTEAAFYLLLPLLTRLILLRAGHGWAMTVLAVLSVASMCWSPVVNATGLLDIRSAGQWLPGYLDWFAAGMMLALIQVQLAGGQGPQSSPSRRLEEMAESAGTCWLAALAVFAIATSPLAGPTSIAPGPDSPSGATIVAKNVLYLVLAVLVVLPLVIGPQQRGVLRHLLASRALDLLGEVSYGIFLWHLFVLEELTRLRHQRLFTGSWLACMALVWTISVLAALLSYRFVERPVMAWSERARPAPRRGTKADQTMTIAVRQRS